jgi:DNA-binding MarR family transcriptional regulator
VADTLGEADDGDIVDFLGAVADVQRMISTHALPVAAEYAISGLDRPGALSDYLNVLPSTITSDVDKLVAADMLRRVPSPTDRRVTRIEVTRRGAAVQRESLRRLAEFFRATVAGVALAELHACIETLRKLSGVPQSPVPNPLRDTS